MELTLLLWTYRVQVGSLPEIDFCALIARAAMPGICGEINLLFPGFVPEYIDAFYYTTEEGKFYQ